MSAKGDNAATSGIKSNEEDCAEQEARELKNAPGGSGQEGPDAIEDNASTTTDSRRLSCIDSQRTGLRREDDHGSWRAVYRACHCEVR